SLAAPAARRTAPASPRCCREMALERAESSGVVGAARRQGVDKARKIRWLTFGRGCRPGGLACLRGYYPLSHRGSRCRTSPCCCEDIPGVGDAEERRLMANVVVVGSQWGDE